MYRTALRSSQLLGRAAAGRSPARLPPVGRRFASTGSPAKKKGTWRGTAVRWGVAAGALYWYTTSQTFAEQPKPQTIPAPPEFSDADLPTVDAIVVEKRKLAEARAVAREHNAAADDAAAAPLASAAAGDVAPGSEEHPGQLEGEGEEGGEGSAGGMGANEGAFNPETGEINWDCPCLGGMAHGPCGEDFKAAFSCFVYSAEEPKGMDCIDKFQHMQDCFRKYPEVYGAELTDDGEGEGEGEPAEGAVAPLEKKDGEPEPTAAAPTSQTTETKQADVKAEPKQDKEVTPDSAKADEAEPVALPNKGKQAVVPETTA